MAGALTPELAEAILQGLWTPSASASVRVQMSGSPVIKGWAIGTVCPSCGPGRCDGTTQDCTLDTYYANPANGPRPSSSGGTAQNPAPAYPVTRYGGTAQNPALRCAECGTLVGHVWSCSQFRLDLEPWDAAPSTKRFPTPVAPRCECGSGSSVRSGAHSHWCPCWVAP